MAAGHYVRIGAFKVIREMPTSGLCVIQSRYCFKRRLSITNFQSDELSS
jgi:hypothetical protein